MKDSQEQPNDTVQVFQQCGTCSRTFGHLLNRAFGHLHEAEERALDPLAGGLLNQGHQCGMLWGAALAIGAEAYRRFEDPEEAIAVAVTTTQQVIESFTKQTDAINCREIIGIDLSKTLGLLKFIIKTTFQGAKYNPCYQLADGWAPEAIRSAEAGLSETPIQLTHGAVSCATEVVRQMGATEEETLMVAGFAGGLGLSGNACGALSAAVWMKTLEWCKDNPGKSPPYFNNPAAKKILIAFKQETDGEMRCSEICGRHFDSIQEHSEYIKDGGCAKLIEVLAES